jgi:hypothetical protein
MAILAVRNGISYILGTWMYLLYTSVVTNTVVEQVGITGQQYETWVELEMAEFSVPIHCRQ